MFRLTYLFQSLALAAFWVVLLPVGEVKYY